MWSININIAVSVSQILSVVKYSDFDRKVQTSVLNQSPHLHVHRPRTVVGHLYSDVVHTE